MMIYEPTEAEIFHYGGARHSHLYNRNDQSLCGASTAGLRRGLGMRLASMGGGGGELTNPYDFGDGSLIGMWMPLWNISIGKQDLTFDGLKDLSGNGHDMTFVGSHSISGDSVFVDGVNGAYGKVSGLEFGPNVTQEICCAITNAQSYGRFVAEERGLCANGGMSTQVQLGRIYGFGLDIDFLANRYVRYEDVKTVSQSLTVGSVALYFLNGLNRGNTLTPRYSTYMDQTTFFNRSTGGRGISAFVKCIRFYNRALTADEIAYTHEKDAEIFNFSL